MEAPRREPTERREPIEHGRFEPRVVEGPERQPLGLALHRDITRWGPIFGGFVATIATAIVLSVLGGALGLSTMGGQATGEISTSAAIWGGIVLLVSFFVGGYVAGRTATPGNAVFAVFNSALVWAISLVFGVLLAAIGLGSVVGLLGLSVPSLFGAAPDTLPAAQTATSLWVAFIGMLVALAAAVVGGLVGMHSDVESRGTY
ncbi:MAG: hypothetical protein EPO21_17605 [Chloroflexota bacterium]|nr:MAG: hypothetical protein EPO21_17605 [Chloroflexota bacterium]